jgi:hypothetical protein
MKAIASLCLITVIAVGLPSQTTHLVGPGGLPQVADALAIAAPGDVVHVQAGSYSGFTANIGVTIRALGQVSLGTIQCNPPVGQTLHLVDLRDQVHQIRVTGGRVTLDNCLVFNLSGQPFGPPPLHVSNASVALLNCQLTCNGTVDTPAMLAQQSDITIVDSVLKTTNFGPGTPVIRLAGGRLRASSTVLDSSFAFVAGAACLQASAGAEAWISDSALQSALGYCPIEDLGATTLRVERCTVSPASAGCTLGQPGNPLLGIGQSAPLQNGAPFTLDFHAAPTTLVALHASIGLGTFPIPGLFEQPSALDLTDFWFVGLYATDAAGDASVTFNMPAGLYVDTPLWLEAITIEATFPWQVAPVVGGVIR